MTTVEDFLKCHDVGTRVRLGDRSAMVLDDDSDEGERMLVEVRELQENCPLSAVHPNEPIKIKRQTPKGVFEADQIHAYAGSLTPCFHEELYLQARKYGLL